MNRTRQDWNNRISSTCNQRGVEFFGITLNLQETVPLNLVQIGPVVEENEHADR